MAPVNEGRIGPVEAVSLTVVYIVAKIFITFPATMVNLGLSAAWVIVVFATLFSIAAFLPIALLMDRFPGRSIVEAGEEAVGPFFNVLFCLGYLSFFMPVEAMVLRQFAERALTVVIPELPISVAIFGIVLGCIVAAYMGLEAIARGTRISFIFVGVLFLIVLVLTSPYWDITNIFPVLGPGPGEIITNSFFKMSVFAEVLILAIIYPNIKIPQGWNMWKLGLTSLAISGLILFITVFFYQLTFSVQVAREIPLPTLEMSRLIYFGRFVQRLEPLFLPMWGLAALLKLSIGFYAMLALITRYLKLPYYRPFILPLAVLTMAVAFFPPNVIIALMVDEDIIRVWGWVPAFGLPLILLSIALLRGKGVKPSEKNA